jgi:hypothetical protein
MLCFAGFEWCEQWLYNFDGWILMPCMAPLEGIQIFTHLILNFFQLQHFCMSSLQNIWDFLEGPNITWFHWTLLSIYNSIPLWHSMWSQLEWPTYLWVTNTMVKLQTINGSRSSHFHTLCSPKWNLHSITLHGSILLVYFEEQK